MGYPKQAAVVCAKKPFQVFQEFRIMPRPSVIALSLVLGFLAAAPAAAVTMSFDPVTTLPIAAFPANFANLNNSFVELTTGLSVRGWASALFAGQGWALRPVDPNTGVAWEQPVGSPTPNTTLALMGQYPPYPVVPPPPSPPVNGGLFQNVNTFEFLPAGIVARIGGMINDRYQGVISFLFAENVNTFSAEVLDAGVHEGDLLGGPAWFSFFDRNGAQLGATIEWNRAVDGTITFKSDKSDIAGVQIWERDPLGFEFRNSLRFGDTPEPAPLVLLLAGLAALGLMRRSRSGEPCRCSLVGT
ncbi:PEP-CTERM sorting domain-containing protein [Candidatus Thiodictyon syntrophicum]|nr:PEP-CTERM sorting domain-containing protein [Candidatus Thiodictyon syntrophicum]